MRKKILIVIVILLAAVLLSGCTGSTTWFGLSASGEVAYLANNTAVHAIDVNTGSELWSFSGEASGGFLSFGKSPKLFVVSPVVTDDGLVIIPSSGNDHILYAVDPRDIPDPAKPSPVITWRFADAKGHWIAEPLIVGNRLFAPNADGKIYVLDLADGQSVKKAVKVIEPFKNTEGQPGRLWAKPVTDGTRLYVTSLDHSIFAIDLETYEIVWHEDLGGAIPGSAVLGSDGMLYVGSYAKQLERFDPATGKHGPVLDVKGWIWGTPVVDGDNLYFGDVVSGVGGYFYSYNTKTEKLNSEPVKLDSEITASPLVLPDHILVATESGKIYAVNAEGSTLWFEPAKGKAYTTPVSAGGEVLVSYIDSDYYLIALDNDGHKKWTFPAGK
ncbi:MAG TPA: PQQ-binding-like beta-propeller repeat protein [Anaerolineales bacterium]|nr:PQQ-binding-like beta-propeller repeat protein [Anaerolineales bacterium]